MPEHLIGPIWDAWRTRRKGVSAIAQRQRARLADMVTHARANLPYYRELYRDLPDLVERAEELPVTDKKTLMACFDDWCVDRQITLERAQAFADDAYRRALPRQIHPADDIGHDGDAWRFRGR
ncbi:hypothetical protein [Mesorhizobium comanense]|uniref:hypothetical protein n=1 Tax=Mesorhizobium comanense TaxID=2502215 RepID=UPI001AEDCF94|nr:hypothetical protein [Mesorhizobium comanense]